MKTSRLLSLALILASLPLAAQQLSTHSPALPPAAEEAAESSPQALAAGRELLALMQEITAIAQSGETPEQQLAALRALKARASAIGQAHGHLDEDTLNSALESLMTEEEADKFEESIAPLLRDEALSAALDEIEAALVTPAAQQAAARHSPEAMQAATAMLAFISELNAIAASDSSMAEKIAAVRACKPRAEELRALITSIGMPAIQRAAISMVSEEDEEKFTGAIEDAVSDEGFRAAMDEIGAIIEGSFAPSTPAAEVAKALLATLRDGAALVKEGSRLPRQERIDRLEMLAQRMHAFYPWIERGGDCKAVADILMAGEEIKVLTQVHEAFKPWTDMDEDEHLASASYYYLSTCGEVIYELYHKHLNQPQGSGDDADIGDEDDYEE